MSFDYPYTCPIIDKNIKESKDSVKSVLCDLIEECSPLLPKHLIQKISEDYSEYIYKSIEDNFENIRDSNQDIRKSAEKQIENLKYELEVLKQDLMQKEEEIEELEINLKDTQDEVLYLESKLQRFENAD